jgi:hypothetical protein
VKTEFGLRRGRVRRRRLKVEERSESVVFREREVERVIRGVSYS